MIAFFRRWQTRKVTQNETPLPGRESMVATALLLVSVAWQATAQERSPASWLGNPPQPARGNNSFR